VNTPQEILAFLNTLNLGDIRIGLMPASPDVVGCLYEYGGEGVERRFGVTGVGYENPSFQLVFRGAAFDYNGPRGKAETALRALTSVQPGQILVSIATIYLTLDPQQSPFPVAEIDLNNRHRIGFNFRVKKEPS
jgi:hypothetical protein